MAVSKLLDLERLKIFMNGQWVSAKENKTIELVNPANGQRLALIPNAGREETREAIQAAKDAFPKWAKLTAYERGKHMLKLRDLLLEHKEEVATLMTLEMGKVYPESLAEVQSSAAFLEWFAEEGKRVYGETIPASADHKRLVVIKQPVGVVAAITPWNFPLSMIARKIAPAMAAGCTSIIKPSSQSPLSALAVAKLAEMADIPPGVINVVTGSSAPITEEIFGNAAVRKVSFTGSTEIGKLLVEKSAKQLKRLSLELGGHAPFVVFEDANLEEAAAGAVASKFRNAGQTCICTNRIYVHREVAEAFSKKFTDRVKALTIGDGLDANVQIGPLVNESALQKVTEHVNDAVQKGAELLCGGNRIEQSGGYFFEPTVLGKVTPDMRITSEETFGPVAPIIVFETEEQLLQMINHEQYGLAAYVYTNNLSKAIRISEAMEFGIIGLNDGLPAVPQAPFGGVKESGYGREGGHQGIREYLDEKFISIGM